MTEILRRLHQTIHRRCVGGPSHGKVVEVRRYIRCGGVPRDDAGALRVDVYRARYGPDGEPLFLYVQPGPDGKVRC